MKGILKPMNNTNTLNTFDIEFSKQIGLFRLPQQVAIIALNYTLTDLSIPESERIKLLKLFQHNMDGIQSYSIDYIEKVNYLLSIKMDPTFERDLEFEQQNNLNLNLNLSIV